MSAFEMSRRRFLGSSRELSLGLLFGAALSAPTSREGLARPVANADPKAMVETTSGKVRGLVADGVHIFRGIPFGAPTGGRARFMPPARVPSWSGVRDVLDYGGVAPQQRVELDRIVAGGQALRNTSDRFPLWPSTQSEDCLNLNVWTSSVNGGGKRPVMVWLHPGGFEFGSGNLALNEGTNLVRRGDVVVVAINHRLGALGYLHLSELAGGEALSHSGNVGMLDIVLGLQWVRDNIAAFGGDPGRVLVHGESGGGRKVSALLAMPAAKGLFHRAAIQSGPGIRFPSNETQTKRAAYVLKELGLAKPDLARLAEAPVEALMAAGAKASAKVRREMDSEAPFFENYGFTPVIGPDLPSAPFDPGPPEVSSDVPVLIGTNRHEMSLAFTQDPAFDAVSEEILWSEARSRVGRRAEALLEVYRDAYPDAGRRDLLFYLAADFSHRMDSIAIAERKAAQGRAPVFMYRFDWESPVLDGLIKAAHTYEIPHVFDNAQLCAGMTGGGPDAVALAARMSAAWIAFAATGEPNTPDLPDWPAYDTQRRATMIFNDVSTVEDDPGRSERIAWRAIEEAR